MTRWAGPFENPNGTAAVLAVLVLLVLPWIRGLPRWSSVCLGIMAAGLAGLLLATGSRGGVLALAGGAVVATWHWWRAHPRAMLGFLTVGLAALALSSGGTRWATSMADPSTHHRLGVWWSALAMIHDNPWGLGGSVHPGAWVGTWYVPQTIPQGTYRSLISSPLTILAHYGWGVFIILTTVSGLLLGVLWTRAIRDPADRWAAAAGGAVTAVLVGSLFSSLHLMPGVAEILAATLLGGTVVACWRRVRIWRIALVAVAGTLVITLGMVISATWSASQHELRAVATSDGPRVYRRGSNQQTRIRIVLPTPQDQYAIRARVTDLLDDTAVATVVLRQPDDDAPITTDTEEVLCLCGGAVTRTLAQEPTTLPAGLILVDAPLGNPVLPIQRMLIAWPVPVVLVGADDADDAAAVATALARRDHPAVSVDRPQQALAALARLRLAQAQRPVFVEPDAVVVHEPGQRSATVPYRIHNPSPSTLRLVRLQPFCPCYSIDPSAWRDIPPGGDATLLLLVDLRPFLTGIRKPVVLTVSGDTGSTWDIRGSIDIQVACTLELPDGDRAVLRDGQATLRLLSTRPDLVTSINLTAGAGVIASTAPRPTGYDLRFAADALIQPVPWAAIVTLANGTTERLGGTVAAPP